MNRPSPPRGAHGALLREHDASNNFGRPSSGHEGSIPSAASTVHDDAQTARQCVFCDSPIPVGAQCRNEACPKVREALSVRVLAEKIAKLEARVAELEKHAIGDGK